jgi:hypothetical protein
MLIIVSIKQHRTEKIQDWKESEAQLRVFLQVKYPSSLNQKLASDKNPSTSRATANVFALFAKQFPALSD